MFYICKIIQISSILKLSKTSDYALRLLAYMAREEDKMYSAKFLVETLSISDKYLRRILTDLTKAGFVFSVQGREGGYKFAKPCSEIYLSDVINAFEGMDQYSGCILGFCDCNDKNPCALHHLWADARVSYLKIFNEKTIYDISKTNTLRF